MGPSRTALAAAIAVVLLSPAALAQTEPKGPEADLSMRMQAPAATPLVGTAFQLVFTITNNGPEVATDAVFSQYVPAELELLSVTSSDPSDDCTPGDEGDSTTTPPPPPPSAAPEDGGTSGGSPGFVGGSPGYYRDAVNCALGSMAAGNSSVITLEMRRVGARESYSSAWVGSSLPDSRYEDNYAELAFEADTSKPADVGVTMDGPRSPAVGANFDYTLKVTNHGPSTADAVTLFNPAGYGSSFVSVAASRPADSCRINDYSAPEGSSPEYGGYSEIYCSLAALQPDQTVNVTVTANRASAYEIWNSASVQTTNYDSNYENDYAYFTIAADPSVTSDLGVRMTAPDAPLVGTQFDLTIDVTNGGPAASGDTWLSNYLPPGLEFVSASDSCSFNDYGPYPMADAPASAPSAESGDAYYPISPGGVYCSIGSIASGASSRVTVTVRRTAAREIWNSAWVSSSNHDPNYENNYSDLLIGPDKSNPADVSVKMSAPTKPDVGANFAFTIEVTNDGPSTAQDVVMTNTLPYEVEFRSVSSNDPSDTCVFNDGGYAEPGPEPGPMRMPPYFYGWREVRCDMGAMEPGQTSTVTVEVTRTSEYEIWNSAWISTANYDEDYENDYASVLVEGEPYPGACPVSGGPVVGTGTSDNIVVGDCYAETKGGADSVSMVPPSSGTSSVNSGGGPDTIDVNLSVGASTRRSIKVVAGRGRDTVRVTVAPGAGNALIEIFAGDGNDTIEIDAPAGIKRLRIVIYGGDGNDSIAWTGSSDTPDALFPAINAFGGAGTDLLQGGFGNDKLNGGAGGDRLFGNLGDDMLRGGPGYDVCRGGPGDNLSYTC
jgi:uncharacterized repeat protein (TIGR01451 family)